VNGPGVGSASAGQRAEQRDLAARARRFQPGEIRRGLGRQFGSLHWTLPEAVDAGTGVALLPCALGDLRPGWRRVALVREVSAPLWILTHKDLRTTARVRVVRDYLTEAVTRHRGLIEGRKPRSA
jgi:DNA-binding transcriptional LysR family regulator